MSAHHGREPGNLRSRLIHEAVRLMAEQGIDDPLLARRKAAHRLGLSETRHLPTGQEIIAELRDYLALFQAGSHERRLRRLRAIALEAMARLAGLADVRLVGPVLEGTAVDATPVTLHLLGITAEEVAIHLLERGVPYRESAYTACYGPHDRREIPAFLLRHGETAIELLVFAPDCPRQAPISPITGKAMRRARAEPVARLLEA
ncbi:MAG: hypothetical protein R3298_08595 [Gammaproteobacteria bacterium]|nr:hypothetical protein [Gammaproteobacteria bacterium]